MLLKQHLTTLNFILCLGSILGFLHLTSTMATAKTKCSGYDNADCLLTKFLAQNPISHGKGFRVRPPKTKAYRTKSRKSALTRWLSLPTAKPTFTTKSAKRDRITDTQSSTPYLTSIQRKQAKKISLAEAKLFRSIPKIAFITTSSNVQTRCFPKKLLNLIEDVKSHYNAELIISSGYRSLAHNRNVGGAKLSQHLECKAVDFRVKGIDTKSLTTYVKSLDDVGGVGRYCNSNYIHMDIGPKRSWYWGCNRYKKARRHLKRYKKRKASYTRPRRMRKRTSSPKRKKWTYNFTN